MRWTVLLLAIGGVAPPAEKTAAKPSPPEQAAPKAPSEETKAMPPKTRRIQLKAYQPSVGDRATLYAADEKGEILTFWVATTPAVYREMVKAEVMEDEKRQKELEEDKKLFWIQEDETPVVVLGLEMVPIPTRVVNGIPHFAPGNTAAVRVLDGPHKGEVLYTDSDNVTRLRTIEEKPKGGRGAKKSPKTKPKTKAEAAKAVRKAQEEPAKETDETRAASLLKLGQSLEKSGKPAGALEFYRKLVKQFPNTPQAKTAQTRIEALGDPAK